MSINPFLSNTMTQKGSISRNRIIEAANRLIYEKGYNQTSFADIASAVGITKGNLHYHFKSKEELLDAIISYRTEVINKNLNQWDEDFPDAKSKLKRFVKMLLNEKSDIVSYGCPLGSLNVELGKFQLSLQSKAREMFDLYQNWLENTFKQLGCRNYKALSKHLLTMTQGAALMSYVYSDAKILKDEYKIIEEWIDKLV
jgi:TetR/AcrR family transcriptional repressor of nem operon